jgi:Cu/Ag efflux protein CusF
MRWQLVSLIGGLTFALGACSRSQPPAAEQSREPVKQYELRGEIKGLDNGGKIAKIQHGQIGDWMPPMTMDFPVKDPAEFAKLQTGEKVRATVFVQGLQYWLSGISQDNTPESPTPGPFH